MRNTIITSVTRAARTLSKSDKSRLLILAVLPAAGLLAVPKPANAATFVWDGAVTGNSNFTASVTASNVTTTNWVSNTTPGSNDDLQFAGTIQLTPTNNTTAGTVYNSLSFNSTAGAFNVGGLALTLSAGITNLASGTEIVGLPVTLSSGDHAITTTAGGPLSFTSAIVRAAGATAQFNLGGTVTLTGATATNGVLSSGGLAFATVGGTDWASLTGSSVSALASYQTSNDSTTWATTDNVSLNTDPAAPLGTVAINTLKFSDSSNVNVGTSLTLGAGGLLVTGTGTDSINGGTLKGAGGATKELVVLQNNTTNAFTIGSIIADNGAATGLTKSGAGALQLNGANTYTGPTVINAGALIVGSTGALGSGALVLGQSATGATAPSLTLNSNATVATFTQNTNSASIANVSISGSNVLTINGVMTLGITSSSATATTTALAISGNELDLNNTLNVGLVESGANRSTTNLDMSGLAVFKMVATGSGQAFNFGAVQEASGTVKLANTSATITTNTINVSVTTANAGTDTLDLGSGTNTLNANTIIIGQGKGTGIVQFLTANGSLSIAGTAGGSSTANITIGNETSATASSANNTLNVAQHQANIQANNVILGQLNGASSSTGAGSISFDTGTLTISNLSMANDISGSNSNVSSTLGTRGTLTLGSSAASTGVLNVNSTFSLANATNTGTGAVTFANGTFTINGGTANINADIVINKAANTTATVNTILSLNGGILNMMGHQIAPVSGTNIALTTLSLPAAGQTAVLENLGGTGINGAGLNSNGAGTLILAGNNTYTTGTTVTTTLQVGSPTLAGSLSGNVTSNGLLTFAGNGTSALNTLTGSGNVALNAGNVSVVNGTGLAGNITVGGGNLTGNGTVGNVILASGSIQPGTSSSDVASVLTVNNLTVNGGSLTFNLDSTTSTSISAGTATFTATPTLNLNLLGNTTSGQQFTILTATTLADNGNLNSLAPTFIGRTTLTPSLSGSSIIVTVSGGAASLVWSGGADGTTWDSRVATSGGTQNWLNGATPDFFFSQDSVTLNDTNGGHYNVTINGQVTPAAVNINNSAGDYTFSGANANSGIGGVATITKSGSGNATFASNNTDTGDLIINAGGVTVASGGSIADGNITIASGASFSVATGGNISSTPNITDNGTINLNNPTRTIGTLNGSGTVNLTTTALTVSGGTFTGSIAGTGSLIVAGGTFQIGNGGTSGSIAVPTTVNTGGTLAVNFNNTPFATAITGAGGVQVLSSGTQVFTGPVTYTGATALTNGSIQLTGANTDNIGAISGTQNLIVGDGSTSTSLTLGGTSTFTGSATVNSGSKLVIPSGSQIATTSGVTVNNATIVFGNNTFTNNWGPNAITVGTGNSTLQYTNANTSGLGNATVGSNISLNGNLAIDINDSNTSSTKNTFNVAGAISGSGNLSVINSGNWAQDTVLFAGTNTMSGTVLVGPSGGAGVRFEVNSTGALGTANVIQSNGSQFWINVANSTYSNNISIVGIGTPVDSPTFGAMRLNANVTLSGSVTLSGDALVTGGTNGSNPVTLSGVISGAHQLTTESGVFTLSNAANNWGAATAGSAATVVGRYNNLQSSTIVIGTAGALSSVGGLQLAGGGVELNGSNITLPNLSSTAGGTVVNTATTVDTNGLGNGTGFIRVASVAGIINGDYVSGPNIPVNTYVTGVATATEAPKGTGSNGTNSITLTSVVGLLVNDTITGPGLPAAGATIASITGNVITYTGTALTANETNQTYTVNTGPVLALSNTLTGSSTGTFSVLDGSVISNNGANANGTVANLTVGSDNSNQTYSGLLLDGTSGGKIAFNKLGTGTQTLSGANTYSGGTSISAGTLIAASVTALGKGAVAIHTGGTLQLKPGLGTAVQLPGLTFDGTTNNWTGALDITNNKLVVEDAITHATSLANLQSQANSAITATGLPAYYAVAVLDNALLNKTTFGNVTVDANSILIAPEILGDANADGTVDANDLNTVLNNFGATTAAWTSGNFDGSSTIDLTDLADVINNFGRNISADGLTPSVPTPEPTSLAVLGLGAVALLRRRRTA